MDSGSDFLDRRGIEGLDVDVSRTNVRVFFCYEVRSRIEVCSWCSIYGGEG